MMKKRRFRGLGSWARLNQTRQGEKGREAALIS